MDFNSDRFHLYRDKDRDNESKPLSDLERKKPMNRDQNNFAYFNIRERFQKITENETS